MVNAGIPSAIDLSDALLHAALRAEADRVWIEPLALGDPASLPAPISPLFLALARGRADGIGADAGHRQEAAESLGLARDEAERGNC